VTNNLSLNGTYSFIQMKNPVYATPEHQLFLSAHYRYKKVQLMGSIQQILNLDNDAGPVLNKVDYTLLKAKAIYTITGNLKFYVSGENLLNSTYQVNRYYTMPGTTIFAGLNVSF
jgi:iron complex outermembrane receptor protein